jgi:hypothetical protein
LMALEMGKPVAQGIGEINKCMIAIQHYVDHGHEYMMPENIKTEADVSYTQHQPLGIIFSILFFNFSDDAMELPFLAPNESCYSSARRRKHNLNEAVSVHSLVFSCTGGNL